MLLVRNFSLLTGTHQLAVNALPWLLVAAAVGGVLYALWLRSRHVERYAELAPVQLREPSPSQEPEVDGQLQPLPAG